MQANTNTYLNFIELTFLDNWSVAGLLGSTFSYSNQYPLTKIGEFLYRNRNVITIDDSITYKRITVRINNNGVVLRDIERGSNIGTKRQYIANSGQFIMSRIDARNGAFGIIPEEFDGAIVTNDFPVFDVDKTIINPYFLLLITSTAQFVKFAQSCSSGTTNRQRMDVDMFLNQRIPLPSLAKQEEIVKSYYSKIAKAEKLEQEAKNLETEIEKYLFDILGIELIKNKTNKKTFQLVNFNETSRWDTLFLSGRIPMIKSKYKQVSLSEIITVFNQNHKHESIRFTSKNFPNDEFRYIGMENIEKDTGNLIDLPVVKGNEIKSQTLKVPKNFILYGKLRPYLNKYWINRSDYKNIISSSEFFVFDINNLIKKEFFLNVLSSKIIQEQISDKTSGARMPRINETIFLNLNIPLPPTEIQNEIVSHISKQKNKIKQNISQSEQLKLQAEQEFEQTIFN